MIGVGRKRIHSAVTVETALILVERIEILERLDRGALLLLRQFAAVIRGERDQRPQDETDNGGDECEGDKARRAPAEKSVHGCLLRRELSSAGSCDIQRVLGIEIF